MSSSENKDMDEKYQRICICNCQTGRFITSISKAQIEIIHDTIVKAAIESGDWLNDPLKEMTLQTVTELKEYLNN